MNASGWTWSDIQDLWFAIGLLSIVFSLVVFQLLRDRKDDDQVLVGIGTYAYVSTVRVSCVIGFIAGGGFIIAALLVNFLVK
jgi:hypothetical protein